MSFISLNTILKLLRFDPKGLIKGERTIHVNYTAIPHLSYSIVFYPIPIRPDIGYVLCKQRHQYYINLYDFTNWQSHILYHSAQ